MTRSLVLLGAAIAAVVLLVNQPAFANDTPHKQIGALVAITVPFLVLDIVLSIRARRRRTRWGGPQRVPASYRARTWVGRWLRRPS